MQILIILIAISMLVAVFFLVLFIMNVKKGQYDDMVTPAIRILFESHITNNSKENGDEKHADESK